MGKRRRLLDEYRFPGYRARADIKGVFGDPRARVIRLERVQKKRCVAVVLRPIGVITTGRCGGYGIYPAGMHEYTWRWMFGGYIAARVGR